MKNILVTGANGQLGNELRLRADAWPDFRFYFTDIGELDITDAAAVDHFIRDNDIRIIINCAAYTAVDKAEQEKDMAFRINAGAAGILARSSAQHKALLIHISSDYVFDGTAHLPYREDDAAHPVGVYANSKNNGEQEVMTHAAEAIILRTSWLYSSFGNNFVKTVLRLSKERDQIRMIYDQIGTPTYAGDLAEAILRMLSQYRPKPGTVIYHYSNEGVASWYDFAVAILELTGSPCRIIPIETHEYPLPAARPAYSVLNKAKIRKEYGLEIPYWRISLKKCIELINKQNG